MLYAIVAVLALILDQAVKYWTTVNIVVDMGERKFIPGFLHFVNVHNIGAAFNFLEGARWFFVILCILFVLIVVYALAKDLITHPVCRWAAVIVLAGAVGNCIDRIVCGYVVDMLEFMFLLFNRRFPVFNIADVYITLGVIVFCVAMLLEKPKDKGKRTAAPAGAAAASAGETPAAPKAQRPPRRKRQKLEIPVFEKHDLPEAPAIDPNDPFAEWEKPKAPASAPAEEPSEPAPAATVYTQPEPTKVFQPVSQPEPEPAPAMDSAPTKPFQAVTSAEAETPAAPEPAPAAPAQPVAPARDEFDLDAILAEFKDL